MADDLRVPKHRAPADVLLPGGAWRRVALFLAEAAPGHAGPERPSDLLNGPHEFFPAFDEAQRTMTFLQRSALALVRVARGLEEDEDEADALTLPTEHDVEVLLSDGTALQGLVSYLRPPDRGRLVDFLNEAPPFFRLLEPAGVALVNTRHVARVALLPR